MNRNKLVRKHYTSHYEGKYFMISVGIDVSKGKSTVCLMKPGGEVLKRPFDVSHSKSDVSALADFIKSYGEEARIVLESTGHYHWPIAYALSDEGMFVCVVNPYRMKRFCSQSIRRAKTDKIDSIHIAAFGITYWSDLVQLPSKEGIYNEMRMLSRQYHQTLELFVKAKMSLQTLADKVMPGIDDLIKNNQSNLKLTDFMNRYWHFDNILAMGEKRFCRDYVNWTKKQRYHNSEQKAKLLFAKAQSGISVLPFTLSTKIAVTEAAKCVYQLEASRKTILTQLTELAKSLPEYETVREMSCVGDILTPLLIAEIGDLSRFKNKHALIAYAGIDAPPYQSGTYTGTNRHISKRGNGYLRKIGYEIMQSLLMHKPVDDPVYAFISKKRDEGMGGKKAMIAGLNKFFRVYYGKVTELYRSIEA